MAVKRNSNSSKPTLDISNEEFKQKISDRIKIGEDYFSRSIENHDELDQLNTDFKIWDEFNTEYLEQIFDIPDNEYASVYGNSGYTFMGQIDIVPGNPVQTKRNLIKYKLDNLHSLVSKSELIKSTKKTIQKTEVLNSEVNMTQVFIVHGHDDLAKVETARFIEKLGFEPIILHEQASSGKTIIEKIENYSNVGFGVVLYTACDIGAEQGEETNLKSRARQNVVFEHGYLIGKIGRKSVSALVKGNVETPNDISGVVYISMDNDWKLDLAKEMRECGYPVDMNKVI